jgi:hypothetical protein
MSCAFVSHRFLAARDAISLRRLGVIDLARAAPPFRPSAAAGSFPCSSGVGSRSSTSPLAISTKSLAAWLKSLGRFGCCVMLEIWHGRCDFSTACQGLPQSN